MPKSQSKEEQETVQVTVFPPNVIDDNLAHTIISNACSRMLPKNFEEAGSLNRKVTTSGIEPETSCNHGQVL